MSRPRHTPARRAWRLCLLAFGGLVLSQSVASAELRVGSKKFTESILLGEIASILLEHKGIPAEHRAELGGSRILFSAIENGEIDLYVEYTGTLSKELLADDIREDESPANAKLAKILAKRGIRLLGAIGFDNRYALGMRRERAEELGIRSVSDLGRRDIASKVRLGLTNEFLHRRDGWLGLREAYDLGHLQVRGLDHDLAYKALTSASVDAIDIYTTDAEIEAYSLAVIEDDRNWFPSYEAVLLVRDAVTQDPQVLDALKVLLGGIDAATMRRLNAQVKIEGAPVEQVAAAFVRSRGIQVEVHTPTLLERLKDATVQHIALTAISLCFAIMVGIPMGIAAAKYRGPGRWILSVTGILQTIPSLALLVMLIPLVGIGAAPAILALFLYSLLPIVRGVHAGMSSIPHSLLDSADALGLTSYERLTILELPMALPSTLSGIKTAAVINVGTATLGALVGAGGYGQAILAGIRLDSTALILEGALPSAALAIAVQAGFDAIERHLLPKGLGSRPEADNVSKAIV